MTGRQERKPRAPYLSAYEIAVQKGFQGTEEEWLASLSDKGVQDEYILRSTTPGSLRLFSLTVDDAGTLTADSPLVSFLGYVDTPEEVLPAGKRRCHYGGYINSVEDLPTTEGLLLPDGSRTAAPAPWSWALVAGRGGGVYVLCSDYVWRKFDD